MKGHRGFTLIEVIVILAVIAILAGMAIPTALRIFQTTAENTTREEMDNIKKAMLGDPQKLQSSFRSDFGFLGDIGCLPTVALGGLDRLSTQGTYPPWAFDSTRQAGAGWKGPYITGTPGEDFKKDQLGNDYTYTPAAGACPLTATLVSNGADGQSGTGDDITISISVAETTATARGTVKDTAGNGLEAVPVELYSAVGGTLTTTTTTTDGTGAYFPPFTSVPFGQRGVKARPRFVLAPGTVTTASGGTDITFRVINYSEGAETIDRVQANYTGGATYNQIRVNGTSVDPAGTFSSGTNVDVTNTVIAVSPATRPSMRVFVDSSDTQLPDITITGQGTAVIIDLNNFSSDMRGIPITVTFNPTGGSPISVLKFTP